MGQIRARCFRHDKATSPVLMFGATLAREHVEARRPLVIAEIVLEPLDMTLYIYVYIAHTALKRPRSTSLR